MDQQEQWRRYLNLGQAGYELRGQTVQKRLLMIYDFLVVPHKIGDIVQMHMRSQVLRHELGVDKVDYAFIWEPANPTRLQHYDVGVTSENYHFLIPTLTQAIYLYRHVGAFHLFDSHQRFEQFLSERLDDYHVWPSAFQYFAREDAFGKNHDAVRDFHRRHGFVPYFESRPATVQWCYDFWRERVAPNKMVVVHLRNNPLEDAVRNAPLEHWLEFMRQAAETCDATFVLIGAREEIDPRFRELPNVLVAKDFGTSMEQDFVLVQSAQLFLGTPSGPNTMAWYSDTPYVVFSFRPYWETVPKGESFSFATPQQRLLWEPETLETLQNQFAELFPQIDVAAWEEKMRRRCGEQVIARSKILWDR